MKSDSVSVIITTKNEEKNIGNVLKSIKKQIYRNVEVIVVDNNSTDDTKLIARKFTKGVFNVGPERSAQRNFGAKKARGNYVLFLDADMILEKNVIEECVNEMNRNHPGGIIIPEKSFGNGFWAKCKSLEKSFYVGNGAIEAGRFFDLKKFITSGGFDESLTGPEDWDLSQKMKRLYRLGRVNVYILHNEGNLAFIKTLQKKYYYAKKFTPYIKKKTNKAYTDTQFSVVKRYTLFLSDPKKLFKNPMLGVGLLIMKTGEFLAGAIGMLEGRFS